MKSILLSVFALTFLCSASLAQTPKPPNKTGDISAAKNTASQAKSTDTGDKKDSKTALKLTDAERKALEPLQQAVIEANQELAVAADALDTAKAADVLAAAWRWKAALTAFKSALRERGNWIAATAKAKGCEGCELNLQTMELQKAQAKL